MMLPGQQQTASAFSLVKGRNALSAKHLLLMFDDHDCSMLFLFARVSRVDLYAGCRFRPNLLRMFFTFLEYELADFLTKHVDAATMLNCMTGLGLKFQSGESKLTWKA